MYSSSFSITGYVIGSFRNNQAIVDERSISRLHVLRGSVAQWIARLTRNVEVDGSSPIKGPRCFLEHETLPLLFSTGCCHRNGFERDFTIALK